jgi:hypothetical protein
MSATLEYIDPKGRIWNPFTVSFTNETDDQSFAFTIFAIDHAHAVEQLQWIRENGKVDGQIVEYVDA